MMILKNGFFFIHNPKAAGNAIRDALSPISKHHPSLFWHQGMVGSRICDLAHLDASDRRIYNESKSLKFFGDSFMVVRDPIRRFLSAFSEHCRQHSRSIDIQDFIQHEVTTGNLHHDWRYIHFKPQYLFPEPGTRILQHENLATEWPVFCREHFGEEYPLKVTRKDSNPIPIEALGHDSLVTLVNMYYLDYKNFPFYAMPVQPEHRTHAEAIEFIHSPHLFEYCKTDRLTDGELKAWKKAKS